MDIITLPMISMDMTPREALERMHDEGQHAAVAEVENEFVILMNHDLVQAAESTSNRKLGQLKLPGRRAHRLLQLAGETDADTEDALDEMGVQFGIAEKDDRLATVVTRHETLAYEIRSAAPVCRCRGNFHKADSEGTCIFDGTKIDCY